MPKFVGREQGVGAVNRGEERAMIRRPTLNRSPSVPRAKRSRYAATFQEYWEQPYIVTVTALFIAPYYNNLKVRTEGLASVYKHHFCYQYID